MSAARRIGEGEWLDADRSRFMVRTIFAVTLAMSVGWVAFSHGGLDPTGQALGGDFPIFYMASQVAAHNPAAPYDVATLDGAARAVFPKAGGAVVFLYPPTMLLLCLPLASFSYTGALAAWLLTTGAAYVAVVRGFLGRAAGWIPILAFPGLFINAGNGHNGFLSAALIGGGALLLGRAPLLAGVCFGLMAFKPHLALLVPFALIAARRWDTLAAAATAIAFSCASVAILGLEPWRAFLGATELARRAIETDMIGYYKMQSAFGAMRLFGFPVAFAYAVQAVLSFGVIVVLFVLQRRSFRNHAEGAALAAACLLGSPHLMDYDLTLLAIPLAFLTREGIETGFRTGERWLIAGAFVWPLFARTIPQALHLPLTPLIALTVFGCVVARGLGYGAATATPPLRTAPAL